jgi:hypothetical protein
MKQAKERSEAFGRATYPTYRRRGDKCPTYISLSRVHIYANTPPFLDIQEEESRRL